MAKTIYPEPYCTPVDLNAMPVSINLDGIEIKPKECFKNSYNVSLQNPNTLIVEGIVLLRQTNQHGKVIPHIWNKFDGKHFDVTSEHVFGNNPEVESILYFPAFECTPDEFANTTEWEFSELTTQTAAELTANIPNTDSDDELE